MITRNGALVFGVNQPELVLRCLPTAKIVKYKGKDLIAVKQTLDATRVLRNLGLKPPSIMESYTWPGMFTPMHHQYETAEFAVLNRKCFILSQMGTGKTSACLWAVDFLKSRGYISRVLVVCPLSVIGVWEEEIFKVLPHRSAGRMVGKREKRLSVMESGVDFCIINFDGLTSLYHEEKENGRVKKRWSDLDGQFDLIIVDEAATYRNANTNRYKALKHLNKPDTRLWMVTGTPVPNAPTDAWAQCRLVNPSSVPGSFKLFQETVMQQVGPYKWVPKVNAKNTIRKVMRPAIMFSKDDCLDLPPITYNSRHCELTPEQKKMFEVMKSKLRHSEDDVEITAANAAVKIIKLMQICCGVVKDDNEQPVFLDCHTRLNVLDELVEQAETKVIVFAPFKHSMEVIREHLAKQHTVELVNGDVSANERTRIFNEFQHAKEPRILVAHPAVAAHGLTLTAASTIVWYAPIYSLEQYEQANARINRKGQENHMSIYHIVAHPFEQAIFDVLAKKNSMQNTILDLYRQVVD